jgi:hypothetical protein
MKSKNVKTIAILTVLGLVFASPARAILGLGDIVFDPQNYAQAIKTFIQLEQQYAQLIQIYQQERQQYEQLVWMGKSLPANVRARYRALATPWTHPTATNTYGTTGGWMNAINSGSDAEGGYSQASQKLDAYGSALGNIPSDQLDRMKTSYATVELTDGANQAGIETIGRLRANAPAVERTLQALEDDSLSSDPDMNTEVAVLNKINAANLISLRNTQDTNQLLVSLAESQIVSAKRARDAEAQAIHQHVRFMTEGKAVLASQANDASQAMLAWRMP